MAVKPSMGSDTARQEYCEDCEGGRRLVTRAPTLADNTALPAAFEARTGDLIYDGLVQGFRVRARACMHVCTQRPLSACWHLRLAHLLWGIEQGNVH